MASALRVQGREHFPGYPKGFIVLRIFQLIFAIIIVGLSAYSVYWIAFIGDCLMLFTSTITFIVTLWIVSAHSCAPKAYNYWAVLTFDILLLIFWLISFALLAVEATAVLAVSSSSYYDYWSDSYYYSDIDVAYGAVLAAAAGLGAIEFLLFFISLIIHSVVVCRHRRAGLRNRPMAGGPPVVQQMQMQPGPGGKPTYEAVPQHGLPHHGQDTAYNPSGMYNAPGAMYNGPSTMYNPPLDPHGFPPQQQQFSPQGQANQMYSPEPAKQGYYPQQSPVPVSAQHTGGSFVQNAQHTSTPPPQGVYEVPSQGMYQPHSPQAVYEAPSQGTYETHSPPAVHEVPYQPYNPQGH